MKTIKLRDEKEVLDRQYHTDLEALRNLQENYQQLINRENDLDEQIERMKSRQKACHDAHPLIFKILLNELTSPCLFAIIFLFVKERGG